MKKTILGVVAIVVLALGLIYLQVADHGDGLVEDMVELDRHYIPALAKTSEQQLPASRKAMAGLLPVWERFQREHKTMRRQDQGWAEDLRRIDEHIQAAARIVDAGSELKQAHEELEEVRNILLHLRVRNGINYFVDHLTRFHEPMEHIVLTVKGKSPAQLGEQDISSMKQQLLEAKTLWQQVMKQEVDGRLFGFSAQKVQQLQALRQQEQVALSRLDSALQADNKEEIIAAGVALKPTFARIFKMFGDFEAIK